VFALFHAAGVVGAGERSKACLLQLLLERLAQFLPACGIATAAWMAWRTHVAANEDVMREGGHIPSPKCNGAVAGKSLLAFRLSC
jgi:hypothetical protein